MSTRWKQALVVAVGLVVAGVMVFLGLWQAQVFVDKGNRTVAERAEQAPVPLLDHVTADNTVGDIYGKRVTVTGRYLPEQQLMIPTAGGHRVLSAFQIEDGRVLPVVRGLAGAGVPVTAPPAGDVTETGLFLPGEGDAEAAVGPGQLGSVRMPLLAQRWSQPLLPGFITVDAAASARDGLERAPVALPQGEGSFQNGGYALQWWVFAAFALGMALKLAQSFGARDRAAREASAWQEMSPEAAQGEER